MCAALCSPRATRSGVLAKSDAADAVLIVFADYIRVMRRLQKAAASCVPLEAF